MEQQNEQTVASVEAQQPAQEKKPARKPRQTKKKTATKKSDTSETAEHATAKTEEKKLKAKKPRQTKRKTQKAEPATEQNAEAVAEQTSEQNAEITESATEQNAEIVAEQTSEQKAVAADEITTTEAQKDEAPAEQDTTPDEVQEEKPVHLPEHEGQKEPQAKEEQPDAAEELSSKAELKIEEETGAEQEPAVIKPETRNEAKAENKTDAKPETKDEAKAENKTDAKPETKNEAKAENKTDAKPETKNEAKAEDKPRQQPHQQQKQLPPCPTLVIHDIIELVNAPARQLLLNDQQIQQLSIEEAAKRFRWIEGTLALALDYDIVISDTNIWLELLTGHTSSHSDPRFNCRLQFERQLEFISRLTKHRGGRFMMMSETYEEIDRFASQMEPQSHKDADFSDDDVCRNISARLAKRLILSQQRENRLRIEGIGAESHHSAFADPAIIRRCVELFAQGRRVLLLTNDASVAIRSMGMCDDLQRTNGIDDETWDRTYAPLRPMVMTFDDLKAIDAYTRQYHFLQMATGKQWMEDVPRQMQKHNVEPLALWMEGFKPGDRHAEKKTQQGQQRKQKQQQQKPQQQPKEQKEQVKEQKPQQPKEQKEQQKPQQQQKEQKEQQKPQQQQKEQKEQQKPQQQQKEQKEQQKPQQQKEEQQATQSSAQQPKEQSAQQPKDTQQQPKEQTKQKPKRQTRRRQQPKE